MKRKDFLQSVLGASAFIGLSLAACNEKESLQELVNNTKKKVTGNMFGFSTDPIQKVRVGIIGLGDIGMEIAKRCHAFGMNIFYYQRTRHNRDIETLYSATFSSFNDLIQKVDYIILVIPHTDESEGLIGKRELKMMKKSATLINVGRGGLIKEMELIQALQTKEIKMAGLDVYEIEPLPSSSPLIKLDNVVLLPHTGAGSNKHWDIDIPSSLKKIKDFFES